ncbi:MAG: glycosyltransferase family 4 protein [Bacteroidota bacterium]
MNILQICSKSPWPPGEGGPIAMNNITQGLLKAGHNVKIFAISTPKYAVKNHAIPDDYKKQTGFDFVYINTNINAFDAFINLFSKKSYNIERFVSNEANKKINKILSENTFDVIQIEGLFVTPYIPVMRSCSKAKIILRAHNVEHLIWQRLAKSRKNSFKKYYLNLLAKKLRSYELKTMNEVDGIAAITPVDAETFLQLGCKCPIISIPVGVESGKLFTEKTNREFPGFFHLGSMDWMPNQEGIKWFLENVWNVFHKKFPQYTFLLAGRNMPEWINEDTYKGIRILGEVSNAYEFMQSKTVMIVPLLSGSGMRVKIIEGMASGNTIITSTVGAEGIHCQNGKNILIANSAGEWIDCLIKCIENPDICTTIGNNAVTLVKEEYDNNVITQKLVEFYQSLSATL